MYSSLQGQYIELIRQHGFSLKLLKKPVKLKYIKFSEDSWAKKEDKTGSKVVQSKFYSVPQSKPFPKKKQPTKPKRHGTTAMKQDTGKECMESSIKKNDVPTMTVPEKK